MDVIGADATITTAAAPIAATAITTTTTTTTGGVITTTTNSVSVTVAATTISVADNSNSDSSTTILPTSPTLSTSQSNDNSFSVVIIVAIVILVVAVFIIISVVVVGIKEVWKRRKSKSHTKEENIYHSTNDEATIKRSSTSKPEPVYNELNYGQDNNKHQYINISKVHYAKQKEEAMVEDNQGYATIPSDYQIEMEDTLVYSIPSGTKQ